MLSDVLSATSIGSQAEVERDMAAFIDRTGVDELIIGGQVYDFDARKRSMEIAMAAAKAVAG
jgi:alkanesulfonate monooxygenase SsuD/methylene tetrahydromethanopterin reductase-like flavin-dependent oxidoreductase (luciferase family)